MREGPSPTRSRRIRGRLPCLHRPQVHDEALIFCLLCFFVVPLEPFPSPVSRKEQRREKDETERNRVDSVDQRLGDDEDGEGQKTHNH